ncbi:MAG: hypothetical protein ACP5F9_06945 [Thiomonas sp.]|jgi:hypothetical protein
MKPTPPSHAWLPVLTERLSPGELRSEEDATEPVGIQHPAVDADVRAEAHDPLQPSNDHGGPAGAKDADRVWEQIAPRLQQRLLEQLRAELDAQVPQIAAKLWQSVEPVLRDALNKPVQSDSSLPVHPVNRT